MNLLTLWPYVLIIPALLLGMALGWSLHAARRGAAPSLSAGAAAPGVGSGLQNVNEAQAELDFLDRQIVSLNEAITAARQQLEALDEEHTRLMIEVDERRVDNQATRGTLHTLEQDFRTKQERLLTDIDASGEELDTLNQMIERYGDRIKWLTQLFQRQESQLQMLRQTVKAKTAEIDEAKTLIEQRDAELRRLIRERQQREADLTRVRQQVVQRNEELRNVLEQQERGGTFSGPAHSPGSSGRHRRLDVTPPTRPHLSAGPTGDSDEFGSQDDEPG